MSAWQVLSRAAATVGGLPAKGLQAISHRPSARRRYVQPGRAHIAVRGLHRPGRAGLAHALEARLRAAPGVVDAHVNAPLGRVIVRSAATALDLDPVIAVVDEFEHDTGLDEDSFAPAPDPGDWQPIVRQAALLGANLTGFAVAVAGRVGRLPKMTHFVPAVVTLVDNTPALRGPLQRRFGPLLTESVLSYGSAVSQTLAQRPVSLAVDAVHRANLLSEAVLRRRSWQRWERTMADRPEALAAPAYDRPQRPAPLTDGMIGRAAAVTAAAATAVSATTLITTRRTEGAAVMFHAASLRSAVLGREAFCAQIDRSCAGRNIVVFDPAALRRMDRVDAVVFDASALLTGDRVIEEVVPVEPGLRFDEFYLHAHALVDVEHLDARREADGWSVRPLGRGTARLPEQARATARDWLDRGATVLRIDRNGSVVGLVQVAEELDPVAAALVQRARTAGTVLIAGRSSRLDRRLEVDGVVAGGPRLLASVQELQAAGRCVALVSARGGAALAAADLGIAVVTPDGRVPWGTAVLCPRGLVDAYLLVEALPVARRVVSLAVRLAVSASTAAIVLAALGPAAGAAGRAQAPLAVAAVTGLAGGTWYALSVGARPPPTAADRTPWHAMPVQAVLRLLRSSGAGISDSEATRRQPAFDRDDHARPGVLQASAEELANPITVALGASAAMSVMTGSALDAALIAAVLGLNAVIGGLQRSGANRALRRLTEASSIRVRLVRAGTEADATVDDLVPGDVIALQSGDAVPADCRLLDAAGLELDESSLTGESQPVSKTPDPTPARALGDRHSMLYEGTAVAAGTGRAVVTATGDATELGRTLHAASEARTSNGVQERLRTLMRLSVPVSVGAGAALLVSTAIRGGSLTQAAGPAINLAVAAVPEGLPFVATVAELAAARRLSTRGTLVRRPATLEALGRVDVLCFDKTGTLTEGHLTLRRVSDGRRSALLDEVPADLRPVLGAAVRATPEPDPDRPLPHVTDQAIVDGARHAGVPDADARNGWHRLGELPFESGRGYHAVLGEGPEGLLLVAKGAPELILDLCVGWRRDGTDVPLDDERRQELAAEADRLARRGYRVLAVAQRPASGRDDLTDARVNGLHLLGLLGLADAVRPTARASVESLRQAGVQIVMVTGDHAGTASAIAEELGLSGGGTVMTGPELDDLDDAALAAALPDITVFARVTPAQKARIVDVFRVTGRTVAVTGDGVNDAPAIRLADVGLALGMRATAAAREAADIVVTDDRLETIVDALLEGRAMWASVRDAITILLGGNLGEVLFTLGAGLVSGRTVLNTRQLMLVNLLTDVLPAMAVAVRPPPRLTRAVLAAEGPESSLGRALTEGILLRAVVTALAAGTAWTFARMTGTRGRATTVGLVALVATQLAQTTAAGIRSPLVLAAAGLSLAALAAVVQTPVVSQFFGCRPLGPLDWGIALATAVAAALVAVLVPLLRNRVSRVRPAAA